MCVPAPDGARGTYPLINNPMNGTSMHNAIGQISKTPRLSSFFNRVFFYLEVLPRPSYAVMRRCRTLLSRGQLVIIIDKGTSEPVGTP